MAAKAKKGRKHFFTSESVTKGHPDKVADQIADGIVDSLLAADKHARVACETLVTTGLVVLAGEITVHNHKAEEALLNVEKTAREVVKSIGYDDPATGFDYRSCAVVRTLHGQSENISRGVTAGKKKEQGAGDQGLMFGFACDDTRVLMPMPIYLAHGLTARLSEARENGLVKWLRPDGKSQVTVEYLNNEPHRIDTIVLSTQHTEKAVNPKTDAMADWARRELIKKVIKPVVLAECPKLWHDDITFHINPTGKFEIGGPHGDSGVTGRKIIVDTYGGRGAHGGGAFSGKDPSKVDRSASYIARYIAKNIVAAKLAKICEVQLSYAIGVAAPTSIHVNCEGTAVVDEGRLAKVIADVFPVKPADIIAHLNLLRPIYRETAHDGHFGREEPNFTWERKDMVAKLRKACKV
ncbi:MAG: methionine adenosyltransferase [Planctomycetes bacterium]|nr:methionine adenosyltransferase [Planctomycetota bacterium]